MSSLRSSSAASASAPAHCANDATNAWPVVATDQPPSRFRSAAHDGCVFLDWCATRERWILTHTATLEIKVLDFSFSSQPELIFDGDGFACILFSGIEHPPLLVEEVLQSSLVRDSTGAKWIMQPADCGVEHLSLVEADSMWRAGKFEARFTDLKAKLLVDIAIFERPRCACHCWWSVVNLYKIGGFEFQEKNASTWLQKHLHHWQDPACSQKPSVQTMGQMLGDAR